MVSGTQLGGTCELILGLLISRLGAQLHSSCCFKAPPELELCSLEGELHWLSVPQVAMVRVLMGTVYQGLLSPSRARKQMRWSDTCLPVCSFDGYILSYQERSYKPDEEIYAAAERLTGLQGSQLCFIDDKVRLCKEEEKLGTAT